MKRQETWVAALATTFFALSLASTAAPGPAANADSLLHPSDAQVTTPSHSPADLDLKRKVRDALVKDETLTSLGKNVAIEARDGNVTLRGVVWNLAERTLVGDIAIRIAGPTRVDNQLDFLRVA